MAAEVTTKAKERMGKAVEALESEFKGIRTGRASAALFERIKVNYYDQSLPLNQVATISIPEARLVVIQPWDLTALGAVEKALRIADMSLNPNNDGKVIRINIPPLTQERRKEIARMAKNVAEQARVSVRVARRDGNEEIKRSEKESEIGEDLAKRLMDEVQKLTDQYIEKVNSVLESKERELMEI